MPAFLTNPPGTETRQAAGHVTIPFVEGGGVAPAADPTGLLVIAPPRHGSAEAVGSYVSRDAVRTVLGACRTTDRASVEEILYSRPLLAASLIQVLVKIREVWGSAPEFALSPSPDPDAVSPTLVLCVTSIRPIAADRDDLRRLDAEWLAAQRIDGLSVTIYR